MFPYYFILYWHIQYVSIHCPKCPFTDHQQISFLTLNRFYLLSKPPPPHVYSFSRDHQQITFEFRYRICLLRGLGSTWLISKLSLFGCLFKEIKFTANTKSSVQVSPCTADMQNFHASYMHSSFFATF